MPELINISPKPKSLISISILSSDTGVAVILMRVALSGLGETLKSKVVKERYAMEKRKIVRRIILAVLLVCAVFLIYSIVTDPLGEHDIMLALAVTAGFIALEQDKRKER